MSTTGRRSLIDLASGCDSALLLGCGGGGDVVQTLPMARYLGALGIERTAVAGLGAKWWGDTGLRFGCEVLDLGWLSPAARVAEHAVLISPQTKLTAGRGADRLLHEAVVAEVSGLPVGMIDVRAGVPGVRSGLSALVEHFGAELVVIVDIGADSFYTGTETTVMSPLLDALSLDAAHELALPAYFALTGYGCDAELPIELLHRNVALAMRHGAFLGAHGLTPSDVAELEQVLERFPQSDIERRPYRAAQGELGVSAVKRFFSIEVLPLAAIDLIFDLGVLVEHVNPLPRLLADTSTLEGAEQAILGAGLIPETRLPAQIAAPTEPQVPDDRR